MFSVLVLNSVWALYFHFERQKTVLRVSFLTLNCLETLTRSVFVKTNQQKLLTLLEFEGKTNLVILLFYGRKVEMVDTIWGKWTLKGKNPESSSIALLDPKNDPKVSKHVFLYVLCTVRPLNSTWALRYKHFSIKFQALFMISCGKQKLEAQIAEFIEKTRIFWDIFVFLLRNFRNTC